MPSSLTAEMLEHGRRLFAQPCEFLGGADLVADLPKPGLPEIAFAGRSNVGKSSLINALTGRKTLARVSHTPGRTRQINFFALGGRLILADLPGYGYARVSKAEHVRWTQTIFAYLRGRADLRRVILLIDARRGLMEIDREAMALLDRAAVSYQLVLTKIDKLKPAEREAAGAALLAESLRHGAAHPEIVATSASTGEGIPELRAELAALSGR